MAAAETVQAYKDLSRVERAFRSLKSVDLDIRQIRHWTAERVRADVFLCMLAYHVEWHLRQVLAPLLFHRPCSRQGRAQLAGRRDRAFRERQVQEGVQALGRWPQGHELRRSHGASRHVRAQHDARRPTPKASLHALLDADRPSGGRLQAPRPQPAACPVAEKLYRPIAESDQALALSPNENFGLARQPLD